MKLQLPARLPILGLAVVTTLALMSLKPAQGEESSYVPPTFSAGVRTADAQMLVPRYPASPLAGGQAAAQGGQFMDVQGRSIVMPANYCAGCAGGGYCETCPGGMGGYSDPMAVDFGGYGEDQCGPHYFDVSAGFVYLQAEELFDDLQPFASRGALNPQFVLDPVDLLEEFQPGWQIAVRFDLGALSVLEATYMGVYDLGFEDSVAAPQNEPFSLSSVFSNYGTDNNGLVPGLDQGQSQRVKYDSDLQSTEFSYRRYWVGENPRISGTWLMGFRYIRLTDDLLLDGQGIVQGVVQGTTRLWNGENDLLGFQLGGDGWICLRQGLRIGCEGKAGIYNNRYKFRHFGDFPNIAPGIIFTNPPADFDVSDQGNQVAFASEGGVDLVADILPSWSLRGGYRVFYMNSVVTSGNNVGPTVDSVAIFTQADAIYHGLRAELEAIW